MVAMSLGGTYSFGAGNQDVYLIKPMHLVIHSGLKHLEEVIMILALPFIKQMIVAISL